MNDADHTTVRSAWLEFGAGPDNRTGTAENMNSEGGRPFLFPGKVPGYEGIFPDVDRITGSGVVYVADGQGVTYTKVSERTPDQTLRLYDLRLHVLSDASTFDLGARRPNFVRGQG